MNKQKLRLGGMALHNGVMLIGPTAWAIGCYLDESDEITIYSGNHADFQNAPFAKTPGARGVAGMARLYKLLIDVRSKAPGAKFAFEDPRLAAVMGSSLLGQILIKKRYGKDSVVTAVSEHALPLAAMSALLQSSDLGRFHGAEHKAVAGYENDMPSFLMPKEHPRCGTGLALVVLAVSGATTLALRKKLPKSVASAAGQLLGIGLGVELMRASEKNKNAPAAKAFQKMSLTAQKLTTKEPTERELDAGEAALNALLKLEDKKTDSKTTAVV